MFVLKVNPILATRVERRGNFQMVIKYGMIQEVAQEALLQETLAFQI